MLFVKILKSLPKRTARLLAKANKRTEQIAQEIMQQLGANKFRAMVGAKDIFYLTHETKYGDSNPAIRFKIMRNAKGVNLVVIALNALDLYDMYFYKTRGANEPLLVAEENDVYADMLRKMFEKNNRSLYFTLRIKTTMEHISLADNSLHSQFQLRKDSFSKVRLSVITKLLSSIPEEKAKPEVQPNTRNGNRYFRRAVCAI